MKNVLFIAVMALLFHCKQSTENLTPEEKFKAEGRSLFVANCIACHSANPDQDGSVGPSLRASSFDLLKEKLVNGKYPEGYKGKRPISGSMPKFAFTDEQIRSIEAFLK